MRSSLDLPWPDGWHRPSMGGWGVPVFCGFGAAFLTVLAVGMLVIGLNEAGAAQLVAAGVLGALAVVFGVLAWRNRPRDAPVAVDHVRVDGEQLAGVRFPGRPAGRLAAAVFRLRRDVLGIVLSPERLVVDLGGDRLALGWDDVVEIRGAGFTSIGRPRRVYNWILISTADDHPKALAVPPILRRLGRIPPGLAAGIVHTRLATDPMLVYHGLRFYLHNPGQRAELADQRAVDRLRAGRLG